ncbi:MAG: hypothetical protein HKN58_01265 [Xanthomonadales bacterium]|nr:hypothetical protein [Xanthomonadales bacterium]
MADVADKAVTRRRALASGWIMLGEAAFEQVVARSLPKGDALSLAEFAGIQGAKQTANLLPLCHPLALNRVAVRTVARPREHAIEVLCYADIAARTGVEMEALCGATLALLTIWDLAKPVNPALEVTQARLLYKSGGKQGEWTHPDGLSSEAKAFLDAH